MYMNKKYLSLFIIISILSTLLTGCAELFQPKVEMPAMNDDGFWKMASVDIMAPLDAPKHLFAGKGGASNKISLSWEKVSGAVAYRIECAELSPLPDGTFDENDKQWDVLVDNVYVNRYDHIFWPSDPPTNSDEYDKRFYYRVVAKNERDKRSESEYSNEDYGTLLSPPRNIAADKGEDLNEINITWDPVENATSYVIYRSRNPDGTSATRIGTRPSNRQTYTDKVSPEERGVKFYYLIYSSNKNNVLSASSDPALGFARVPGAPAKPSGVTASRAASPSNGIEIYWTASGGATKYAVYRSSSLSSSLEPLDESVAGTSFMDKRSLKAGVYYYYQITALNDNGDSSAFSDTDRSSTTHPSVGFILSPPTVIEAEKVNDGISVRWFPAIGSDSEIKDYTYSIYGDTSKDGGFSTKIGNDVSGASVAAGVYIDTTIDPNSFSYFKIETNKVRVKSDKSATFAPSPIAATGVTATKAANPSAWNGGGASGAGVYPVRITWNAVNGATGYHIYRSSRPASNYRKITETPVTGTMYSDNDASMQPQKYYYYKVLSVNDLGQGKNYSDYAVGYGALTATQFLKEFGKQIKSSQKKMSLMHKGGTSALGSESAGGKYSGTLSYNASLAGLGARIIMPYSNYCDDLIKDYYVYTGSGDRNDQNNYVLVTGMDARYMIFNGNTNTKADMSSNGTMDGTVNVSGMYNGSVGFGNIQVKGGAAGGGYYPVTVNGFPAENISYSVIN